MTTAAALTERLIDAAISYEYADPAFSRQAQRAELFAARAAIENRIESLTRQLRLVEMLDAVLDWMVANGWLDADAEYQTTDLIAALNDNAGPGAQP